MTRPPDLDEPPAAGGADVDAAVHAATREAASRATPSSSSSPPPPPPLIVDASPPLPFSLQSPESPDSQERGHQSSLEDSPRREHQSPRPRPQRDSWSLLAAAVHGTRHKDHGDAHARQQHNAQHEHDQCLLTYAQSLWRVAWRTEHEHSGALSKQNKTYYKRWQRRWFVLVRSADALFYFKREHDASAPLGVLFLDDQTQVRDVSHLMNMPWCLGITVASSCSLESSKAFEHRTYYLAADGIEEYNGWTRALADYYAAGNGIASAGAGSNGGGHDTRDNIGYSAECITAGEAIAPPPARAAPLPPHLPLLTLPLAAAVDVRQSAVVCSTAKFKSRASEETSALSSSYESAGSCARTHVRPSDGSGYHGTVITDQTMGSVPAVWDRSASCASQISVKTASPRMVIGSPAASSHISSALPVQHGTQSSSVDTHVAPTNANDYLIPKAGRSVTLYGAFFEAYKCINDYMAYLQDRKREQMERADVTCADCSRADNDCDRENAKAVANHASGEPAQIACAILSHRPINYMDPATVVVRSVRHLLYFIDSTIMKKMHHPDFQPCLKRFMSVVVERSRKVGFLAKSMTESECIGLPRAASLPELIDHLERLTMELQTFVNLAKFISDLDFAAGGALAIMSSSTGSSLMCKTILDCCNDYAKGVQSEKIERIPTVIEKMRLFAQIAAHACHHQFNEGFDFQTPPHQANNAETRRFLFGSTTEMRNIGRQLDFQREELCARFHATKNSAAEESLIVALALAERVFSVALLLVRLAVTLEYLDSIDHEAAAGFWESYNAFSSSCHSVPQPVPSLSSVDSRKLSFDLDEMMATLVGGAPGADTSPRLGSDTIPPSPAVTGNSADCASTDLDRLSLAPIADSQRNHHARSLPTKSDVAALSALQHAKNDSLILRSAPPPPPPIERPYKSFSYGTRATAVVKSRLSVVGRSFYQSFNNPVEQLRYEYSVNAAVVKSVSELHTVVLAASKNMIALWGASQAATALDRHDTIERAVQLSMSIFTAAAQLQEELGALEYQTSTDALIQRLDDAQHALMRAATCFENSVKSLTNFYSPPDAWKDVIMDARRLEDVCAAVVRSIEDVLQHQSSILYRNNQATAGQTLDTSTEAGWFTRSLQPKTSSPLSMVKPVNGEAEQEDLRAADAVKQAEVEAARLELENDRRVVEELLDEEMALLESAPDLVMRDSQDGASLVKGGSLEKLIHFLTSHKLPPADFTSAFLLTYQSFTSARDLLQQLIKRYNVEVPGSLSVEQRSLYCARKVIPVRLRVFNVLKMWIKNNYEDFEADSELLALLTDFLPTMKEDFRKGTADFQALLARKAKGGERLYSTHINHQPPAPILPKRLSELTLLDLDPLELARQITIHQWAHFAAIMPNECLNQAWNNKELQHLAPSIMRMIRCSNFLAELVATEVLTIPNVRSRSAVLRHWIVTAEKMKQLNNYDGVKSILGGLESSSIRRLHKTWEYIPTKIKTVYDDLCRLVSEEKSYKTYRAALHSIDPPCIPFLGVYLTDLTKIEAGNGDQLKDHPELINFHKRRLMAQVILEIKRYQCTPYNFVRIDEVIEWLETRPVMNAEDLYQTSIELEPRAAASGTPSSYSGFSVGHSDNMAGGTGGSAIASGGLAGSMGMFTTRRLSGVKAFAQLRGSSPAGF